MFKTAWFSKAAGKARIKDEELRTAIRQVMRGQAVNLGGGVFKKRLDKNRSRAIILDKSGQYWVFEYLFAKKNLDNIDDSELSKFRKLARTYESLSNTQVEQLIRNQDWLEICYAPEDKIQERRI